MSPDPNFIFLAGTALASVGGSLGVTGYVARSTRKQLDEHVKEDNKLHIEIVDRLARIETKIEQLVDRKA